MIVRRVACVFQCFPSAFEKDAMLRIENLCFPRRDAEKAGVEQLRTVQHRAASHVRRIDPDRLRNTSLLQVNVAEGLDGLSPGPNISPEFVQVLRTRETAREAYDGNGMSRIHSGVAILNHEPALLFEPA